MASYGLTREDFGGADFAVWPDNLAAINTFIALSTQWRTGMAGPTGLDYAAVPAVLRLTDVPRGDWSDVFDCLRVLEEEALKVMGEMRSG